MVAWLETMPRHPTRRARSDYSRWTLDARGRQVLGVVDHSRSLADRLLSMSPAKCGWGLVWAPSRALKLGPARDAVVAASGVCACACVNVPYYRTRHYEPAGGSQKRFQSGSLWAKRQIEKGTSICPKAWSAHCCRVSEQRSRLTTVAPKVFPFPC